MPTIISYFNDIDDPRTGNATRHKFCDIMTISLLCALCGGEILALRELIKTLDIKGIMITADALHCQRETCKLIIQEGGDYCLQLKGNQGDMQADVRAFINDEDTDCIDEYISTDANHGRIKSWPY